VPLPPPQALFSVDIPFCNQTTAGRVPHVYPPGRINATRGRARTVKDYIASSVIGRRTGWISVFLFLALVAHRELTPGGRSNPDMLRSGDREIFS